MKRPQPKSEPQLDWGTKEKSSTTVRKREAQRSRILRTAIIKSEIIRSFFISDPVFVVSDISDFYNFRNKDIFQGESDFYLLEHF